VQEVLVESEGKEEEEEQEDFEEEEAADMARTMGERGRKGGQTTQENVTARVTDEKSTLRVSFEAVTKGIQIASGLEESEENREVTGEY